MLLFKDKINYKLPRGNGFQAHLDAPAYDHIGRIEHVTANMAIDAATLANGCLEVVPGSHRMEIEFSHGGRITDAWEAAHEWTTVPLAAGDILIFGSHLAHRSGPNNTDARRASLYATFYGRADGEDLREKYYAHRRAAFPPDHGKLLLQCVLWEAESCVADEMMSQSARLGRIIRRAGIRMVLRRHSPWVLLLLLLRLPTEVV